MVSPAKIVLIGPSGWVGSAFLARLAHWFPMAEPPELSIFGSHARTVSTPFGDRAVEPLEALTPARVENAHVFHFAFLGKERLDDLSPSDYFAGNQRIDSQVAAAVRQSEAASLFVSSSGAAADALKDGARNLYGLCKLMQEDLFGAIPLRGPVVIGRIFNLGGPHINKLQAYALSSFLLQAADTGKVVIKADRPVYRAFLHVYDAIDLALGSGLRLAGPQTRRLDLCGAEVLEMGQIAERVLSVFGLGPDRVERPVFASFTPNAYLGDPTETHSLALELGLRLRPFQEQVLDTYHDMLTRRAEAAMERQGSN